MTNKICHKIEQLESSLIKRQQVGISILPDLNKHMYPIQKKRLTLMEQFYKEYQARRKFTFVKKLLDDIGTQDELVTYLHSMSQALIDEYRFKCYQSISTNTTEIFEYMMALYEMKQKEYFDFTFVWDILGEDILKIIPQQNSIIYKESQNGHPYLGKTYEIIKVAPLRVTFVTFSPQAACAKNARENEVKNDYLG